MLRNKDAKKRPATRKEDMEAAVSDVKSALSLRLAASKYGIGKSAIARSVNLGKKKEMKGKTFILMTPNTN